MERIAERDWKTLRAMKDDVLNAACERILDKAQSVLDNREGRNYQAYLELFKLIEAEDREIALMFDNLKRSTAIQKLIAWRTRGLLADEDVAQFSDETRRILSFLLGDRD